ncbi:hypothetical protein RIF25_10255 [Thermosynechococcaceae cyanobacterium BACA0444]|uniref:Uncharacterized protein n=1 Tax=Pseudocalidococcus azoricus BACA0444 TaxID=2918990 RepID=A0AAE4FTC9_9CYAN|nr:Asr1405/Asl0597 family protein [Pseudocalidococcus azoricus]MDS3861187.1 hypothetical protein [Pseudocalidococcus azoricus BACA0444]
MQSHSHAHHDFSETTRHIIAVRWDHRWPIYHRLSGLGIRCWCTPYQPLQVEIPSPAVAIQIWSVIRQLTTSRQEQAAWLGQCWQLSPIES